MNTDRDLLQSYAKQRSQEAFSALVSQHLALVFGTALRQVAGDRHLAEDISQNVFTELARQAKKLTDHPSLPGWLHTTTCHLAANTVRGEQRRRAREQEAIVMQEQESSAHSDWAQLGPVLDDALNELPEADRHAILLRFFENRRFAELGQQLGLAENAARMRVERALDKLRVLLTKRGLSSTSAALAILLEQQVAAVSIPAGLASNITATALTTAGTGLLASLGLGGAAWLKLGLGTGGASALIAGAVFLSNQQAEAPLLPAPTPSAVAASQVAPPSPAEPKHLPPAPSAADSLLEAKIVGEIFSIAQVEIKPALQFAAKPKYPFELRQQGISGTVTIDFVVDTQGQVRKPKVINTAHEAFASAALEALSNWSFSPGTKNGVPVNTRVRIPIVFNNNP